MHVIEETSQNVSGSQTVVAPLHRAPTLPDVTWTHFGEADVGSQMVPCSHVPAVHDWPAAITGSHLPQRVDVGAVPPSPTEADWKHRPL